MRRSWSIVLFEHEQPHRRARRAVHSIVAAWNREETPAFEPLGATTWHVNFDAEIYRQVERLRTRLEQARLSDGVEYHYSWRDHIEDQDYASADFIAVVGAAPDLVFSFLDNEATAFVPAPECELCGSRSAYGVTQAEAPVVNLDQLERSLNDLPPPGPGGWDMVTLPTGHLLVSRRLLTALLDNQVRGYRTGPVIDAAIGQASRGLVQLFADTAVMTPCPAHSRVEGTFCPRCGISHGMLDGYFRVPDNLIGDEEVLSRDPGKGSMFYFSRRVYDLVSSAAPNGLQPHNVIMVCRHRPRRP